MIIIIIQVFISLIRNMTFLLLLGVGTIPVSFYWKILFIIHAGCGYLS